MRLYQRPRVSQEMGHQNRRERHRSSTVPLRRVIESQKQEGDNLIKPRKLPNPVLACPQHKALQQELRSLLIRKRVLENKQREQHQRREPALLPPTNMEVKLCRRHHRIQVYELEEKKRSESDEPEFLQVRGTLKHIQSHFL